MNLQFYLEKLKASENYKKFIKENPDAFLCSAFFIIDFSENGKGNKQHFDFYTPNKNIEKIFSFQLEDNCKNVEIENPSKEIPEKISFDANFDFNEIGDLIAEKIQKENIKNKIQKILFSLQNFKSEYFLIGTIFISNLSLIKIQIDLKKMEIIEFEKKSFFDMFKIIRKDKN